MKGLVVLGSTGSIGESTLAVAGRHPERFRIVALAARSNDETLFQQCLRCRPEYVALLDRAAASKLGTRLAAAGLATRVLAGPDSLMTVATLPQADVPDTSVPSGTVVQVVQAGYMIGERILRPELVGVSKGGAKAAPSTDITV